MPVKVLVNCICVLTLAFCAWPVIMAEQNVFREAVSFHGNSTGAITEDNQMYVLQRAMYNRTSVSISVKNCSGSGSYGIHWMIRYTECFNDDTNLPQNFFKDSTYRLKGETVFWYYPSNHSVTQTCGEKILPLADETSSDWFVYPPPSPKPTTSTRVNRKTIREARTAKSDAKTNKVTESIRDGNYIFIAYLYSYTTNELKVEIEVELEYEKGFPPKYPDTVLSFYIVVCCGNFLLTIVWLMLVLCNRHNALRIHHMMSVVLILNALGSIIDVVHHKMLNRWIVVESADLAIDIVTAIKTSVCIFFMIFFSLGDGIAKQKLGKCSFMCITIIMVCFFLLTSGLVVYLHFHDPSSNDITALTLILLVVLSGLTIILWITKNLVTTMRQLHLQNKLAKMGLYICVTIGLILYCLTDIASIALYFKQMNTCAHVWEVLVAEGAFLPLTMSAFLLIVMILIRPTSGNLMFLRYELIDDKSDASDEEENIFRRHKLETVV